LSQPDSEPGGGDTFTQRGAGLGWRSSHWHVPTIIDGSGYTRKGLHRYTNSVYIGGMSKSFASGLTGFWRK
jgi:hypothetical protein